MVRQASEMKPFVVMAKPVGSRCNMQCRYCYYLEKGQFSSHEKQTKMTTSLAEKLIRQVIQANPGPVYSFVWHGGEPTLAGIDFYKRAVSIQKKYLKRGEQCWNNLQTNGLLINEEWAAFLKENRFDVGVSIDGDEVVHDTNRHDVAHQGTYQRIVRSIKTLQNAGIQPDLLCTVNSTTVKYPKEVYRALADLNTGWIQFIPIVVRTDCGFSEESITPEQYGQFLCAVFDEWITHDLGKCDVQLFSEVARVLAGGQASVCWMQETCGQALIAEEDGAIYSCDHFVDDEHRLGNLNTHRLDKVIISDPQTSFGQEKKEKLTEQCKQCPYLKLCHGGCLKDRFGLSKTGEEGQYYLCDGLRMLFEHAEKPLYKAMELSRNHINNEQIMEYFRNK